MPWEDMIPRAAPRVLALACAVTTLLPVALAWGSGADRSRAPSWQAPATTGYLATLEQCVTSATPTQRSVTFTGQMVASAGTQHMAMRIELLEHIPGQEGFHEVRAPGLGVWRDSEPGVKIYRYVKQITNLSAPAVYRAVVHFHWIGANGHVLKRAELRTARCVQPTAPLAEGQAGANGSN